MLGTMQVIRNEPSCYNAACHVHLPHQSVLGVVDIVYPLDEIDTTIRSSAARIAGYSLGFVLIASLCVGILVHRLVYMPLRDIETGAKKLAAGNLDEPIPVRSVDEFGQLAGSFNAMTAALARYAEQAARICSHPRGKGRRTNTTVARRGSGVAATGEARRCRLARFGHRARAEQSAHRCVDVLASHSRQIAAGQPRCRGHGPRDSRDQALRKHHSQAPRFREAEAAGEEVHRLEQGRGRDRPLHRAAGASQEYRDRAGPRVRPAPACGWTRTR